MKLVGKNIARLRKKLGLTQREIARRLEVSYKSVSKWESGVTNPDISLLPSLALCFGVTVDQLFLGAKQGVIVAGNMIMDYVKHVSAYPESGMLTQIDSVARAVGGNVVNIAVNLRRIDRAFPVSVLGKVGNDENGHTLLSTLRDNGIDVGRVVVTPDYPTGFSDIFCVPGGERTIFHHKGANAHFAPEDIDLCTLEGNILHVGHALLLDAFDAPDPEYGTVMARFLRDMTRQGFRTSMDVASRSDGSFDAVIPSLRYCDYVIINEIECCGIWGMNPYPEGGEEGELNEEILEAAMRKTIEAGVREKLIVHAPYACWLMDAEYAFYRIPSVNVPKEDIQGTVGAGDAFCAACLYGLARGMQNRELMEFASAAAACRLLANGSTEGMREREEIFDVVQKYGRLPTPEELLEAELAEAEAAEEAEVEEEAEAAEEAEVEEEAEAAEEAEVEEE